MFFLLVMFRVIVVYPDLRPYKRSVDIAIYVGLLRVFILFAFASLISFNSCPSAITVNSNNNVSESLHIKNADVQTFNFVTLYLP